MSNTNTSALRAGQRWRTRAGAEARITGANGLTAAFPWFASVEGGTGPFPPTYTNDGRFFNDSRTSPHDLVTLIEDAPPAPPADNWPDLTRAAVAVANFGKAFERAASVAAGIGDVTSTAKGSGARYNAGKAPFDLVPLHILGASYLTGNDAPEIDAAINALDCLGQFQAARGDENAARHLYRALQHLGLGGWEECAAVFDYGRRKYAEWNWAKAMAWSVPLACAARHLLAIIRGEQIDPESGKSHRGHVFCNVVMLLVFIDTFAEGDDRPAAGMLMQEVTE